MTREKAFESRHVNMARQLIEKMDPQNEEEVNRLLRELAESRHDKLFCE
jgi:hypothetical protein